MPARTQRQSLYLGIALLISGLAVNKWLLEAAVVPDGRITSGQTLTAIVVLQLLVIGAGGVLLIWRPSIRLPWRKLSMLAASTFLSLGVTELGIRVWIQWFANSEQQVRYALFSQIDPVELRFSPHPYLNHYPTPGFRSGQTSHNSLGYRDREFPVVKPPGVYRIVCLGGSTTYTSAVDDNAKTFPSQLETILKEDHGYENVQVINAGVPGYTSWESLVNLEFRVLDLDPDLVIVYHGTNDVQARFVLPAAYHGDNTGYRQQWGRPDEQWWEHSALARVLARKVFRDPVPALEKLYLAPTSFYYGPDPYEVLRRNPPTYFRRNLESMAAVAREHDVAIMFATWAYSPHFEGLWERAYYQQALKDGNAIVREVAEAARAPVYDFAATMPRDPKYWVDGMHLSELGALLKAKMFGDYLVKANILPEASHPDG